MATINIFIGSTRYELKSGEVNAVLKALSEAITGGSVQYPEGGLEVHNSMIFGAAEGTSMMEKPNKWIQFDYRLVFHRSSRPHFALQTFWK
ncbi:hypothetical protein Y032_0157g3221 [Ancylostoma ceylanicum]|uniref:Uncharacterized protein n=1 Tax=Ancylostoma ceylanicum TaxID=53326 RepID=A0A016SZE7_9BILA|nr:hypothetical protein Y032_0157g3221 [Ancylostoma ceylanicum]